MTKAKTKRFLMKAALGASLAAGVSLFPLMRHIVSRQTADLTNPGNRRYGYGFQAAVF